MTWVVVLDGGAAAWWLALTASVALLLRARLFALPRQRVPLLIGGMVGLGLLGLAATLGTHGTGRLLILLPLLGAASAVLAAGLAYSRRRPSPYLGRTADILDVVAIMALIPLTCAVTGLLGAIRDLFASLGG
jgi:phosphate/sulfate permease